MQSLCRVTILCIGTLLVASACDKPAPSADPRATKKIVILSTSYPLADLARRVGGSAVDVQWLSEGGEHPGSVADTPELRRRASAARAVITAGPGDVYATHDLSDDDRRARVIEPHRMPSAGQAAGDARAYTYLDPLVAAEVAGAMADRLSVVDPARSAEFAKNLVTVRESLTALDAECRAALAKRGTKQVLVVRPIYGAFLKRYGLEQVAPTAGPESGLSDADFKALAAAARRHGLTTVYVDRYAPAPVKQQIADRTGLKIRTLDATGTSAGHGNDSYEKVVRWNLKELAE